MDRRNKINPGLPGYKHRKSFATKYIYLYILDTDVYMDIPDVNSLNFRQILKSTSTLIYSWTITHI